MAGPIEVLVLLVLTIGMAVLSVWLIWHAPWRRKPTNDLTQPDLPPPADPADGMRPGPNPTIADGNQASVIADSADGPTDRSAPGGPSPAGGSPVDERERPR